MFGAFLPGRRLWWLDLKSGAAATWTELPWPHEKVDGALCVEKSLGPHSCSANGLGLYLIQGPNLYCYSDVEKLNAAKALPKPQRMNSLLGCHNWEGLARPFLPIFLTIKPEYFFAWIKGTGYGIISLLSLNLEANNISFEALKLKWGCRRQERGRLRDKPHFCTDDSKIQIINRLLLDYVHIKGNGGLKEGEGTAVFTQQVRGRPSLLITDHSLAPSPQENRAGDSCAWVKWISSELPWRAMGALKLWFQVVQAAPHQKTRLLLPWVRHNKWREVELGKRHPCVSEASWGKGRRNDSGAWHHETHLQNTAPGESCWLPFSPLGICAI